MYNMPICDRSLSRCLQLESLLERDKMSEMSYGMSWRVSERWSVLIVIVKFFENDLLDNLDGIMYQGVEEFYESYFSKNSTD